MNPIDLLQAADHGDPIPQLPAGRYCRRIRDAVGVSAELVAVAVGVAGKTVERWEAGRRPQSALTEIRYRRVLLAIESQLGKQHDQRVCG